VAVIAAVLAMVAVGGVVIFFVATPGGRRAFRSFLDWAAGRTPEEVVEQLDPETLMFLERARQALEANKLDEAEVAANAVLSRVPDNVEARGILLKVADRRKKAEELRRRTIHDEAVREARKSLAAGELDRAEGFAKRALEAVPESEEAQNLLARIDEEKERFAAELARRREQAEEFVRQGFRALAEEEYERALSLADRALALHKENAAAQMLKMQAELEIRRAEGEAEDSRSNDQKRAAADKFYEIARISWDAKDYEGTERFAKKALEIWPAHERAKYLLEKAIKARLAALKAAQPAASGEADEIMAFLEKLDRAIMGEDAEALGRLVSPASQGGLIAGVAATRDEELENARGFFEVASEISIKRKTKAEDVRARKDFADAVSRFRISYRIGAVAVSRQFRARYTLAREGGQWQLRSVTIEYEQP
jgi:tetratricopeptide (TPR) repeat protein